MSTTASFKQQCPSCEAWVPIRDSALIGRKIDCPKCKYRFVVEEPEQDADAEEEAEEAPRRRAGRGDDEDSGEAVKTKSRAAQGVGGLSSKLLLMIGVGVVAVAALIGAGIWMFGGSGSTSQPRNIAVPSTNRASPADDSGTPAEPPPVAARPSATLEAVTNMVPPDAEGLCNIRFQSLMSSELGRTIFMTRGAFLEGALSGRLGLTIGDIDLLIQAWNFTQNWKFSIVHSSKPLKPKQLITALQAKAAIGKDKIGDQEYFLLEPNPWLRQLGRMSFATILQLDLADVPNRPGTLAMRIVDDRTAVFGDLQPVQEFLKVKGRFKQRPPEKPKEEPKPAEAAGQPRPGSPQIPGGVPAAAVQGIRGRIGAPGQQPPQAVPPQEKQADKEEEKEAQPIPGTFLTIDPALKRMLDRVDRKKPVASLVVDLRAAKDHVPPLGQNTLKLKTFIQDAAIVGASLQLRRGFVFTLVSDYQNEETTIQRQQSIDEKDLKDLVARIGDRLDTKVDLVKEEEAPKLPGQGAPGQVGRVGMGRFPGGAPGMGFPGGPGGLPGGIGQPARPMGPGAGLMNLGRREAGPGTGPAGGVGMGRAGGFQPGNIPGLPPGFGPPGRAGMGGIPGMQPGTNQAPPPDVKPAGATVKFLSPDKTILELAIDIKDAKANQFFMNRDIRHSVLQQKGYLDMASGQPRIHDLARALTAYAAAHDRQFPRGTVERSIPGTRANRPYAPDQRVSWMAEILPFLGPEQASLYDHIDRQKSWDDSGNLVLASTLVPQYLDPQFPPNTWWVRYRGLNESVAATHFVGVAGIGMDAAEYDPNDPKVASKIGVFGYDRSTKLADIKNPSGTILVLQVPPTLKRPWMAGGGSTVQGVPETNSVQPFVCIQRDGKPGTLAIMADGAVRFISADIPESAFKAMCAYRTSELVNVNRDAPLVNENDLQKTPAGQN
jgi:hypothetical protein